MAYQTKMFYRRFFVLKYNSWNLFGCITGTRCYLLNALKSKQTEYKQEQEDKNQYFYTIGSEFALKKTLRHSLPNVKYCDWLKLRTKSLDN